MGGAYEDPGPKLVVNNEDVPEMTATTESSSMINEEEREGAQALLDLAIGMVKQTGWSIDLVRKQGVVSGVTELTRDSPAEHTEQTLIEEAGLLAGEYIEESDEKIPIKVERTEEDVDKVEIEELDVVWSSSPQSTSSPAVNSPVQWIDILPNSLYGRRKAKREKLLDELFGPDTGDEEEKEKENDPELKKTMKEAYVSLTKLKMTRYHPSQGRKRRNERK